MKESIQIILLTAFIGISFSSSCKKDKNKNGNNGNTTSDTNPPAINITAPVDLQMYNNGDTVWIKGSLSDASLHECLIQLTNDLDTSVLFQAAPYVHDLQNYSIDTFWKSSVSDHTNATLTISAEDHSNLSASKSVHIHIMP